VPQTGAAQNRLVNDLKTIYDCFTVGFWEKEGGGRSYFTVFQASELEAAVLRSIPAAIELLKEVDPSPRTEGLHPPTGGSHVVSQRLDVDSVMAELTDRLNVLERVVVRVEDRVDTHELYLSQAQNDYEKRRDE
jgi:hypothetical protein